MTEFWLFMIAGIIAVVAAIFMLLSENAIHSALFLVVIMVAIAFLFLLLNAPFLAMIQITVYAGAIMVLFLFVIMLLGSEQPDSHEPPEAKNRFRWFMPAALALAVGLLVTFGLGIAASAQNPSSLTNTPEVKPLLRILNVAPNLGNVDVQIAGVSFGTIDFGETTGFLNMQVGDYQVSLVPLSGAPLTADVDLKSDTAGTLIAYADATGYHLGFAAQNFDTVTEERSGRLVIFNAYPDVTSVSLIDPGSEFVADDTTTLVGNLGLGVASQTLAVEEGAHNWRFVDATTPTQTIEVLPDLEVKRDTTELVVLYKEPFADGSVTGTTRPAILTYSSATRPSFGGPQAIGYLLFTNYLLPFQLLALLLLAAMVGAIVLTHRQLTPTAQRLGIRRRVSRPLVNVIAAQVGHDVTDDAEAKRLADSVSEEPEAIGN